jgi:hypothetical protein
MLRIPDGARPALRFIPPAEKPLLYPVGPLVSWLYTRVLRVRGFETHNVDRLVRLYRRLQDGAIRLIVAFRHPGTEDPGVVAHLLCSIVGREARHLGIPLRVAPRMHFLYGRDVPEWGGRALGWFLPHTGGISVFAGKHNSESINTLRRYMRDKEQPLALAPEGQVTYHSDRVAALEPGTAQLAFWCLEDLRRQGRNEEVMIAPVCTSYHYRDSDWAELERIVAAMEKECGLPALPALAIAPGRRPPARPDAASREKLYHRSMRLGRHLVAVAEGFYARFYGARFPEAPLDESTAGLQERIERVCEAALAAAESYFGLSSRGDFVSRVFAVRYAGLAWIFREDIEDLSRIPALDRALADRIAAEAWLRLRHMELVDILEYIRADYLQPDSGIDRFVESVLNLRDVVNRLEGGNISGHLNPFRKTARIIVNEPIPVSPSWGLYKENRRRAVAEVTSTLLRSFREVADRGNTP